MKGERGRPKFGFYKKPLSRLRVVLWGAASNILGLSIRLRRDGPTWLLAREEAPTQGGGPGCLPPRLAFQGRLPGAGAAPCPACPPGALLWCPLLEEALCRGRGSRFTCGSDTRPRSPSLHTVLPGASAPPHEAGGGRRLGGRLGHWVEGPEPCLTVGSSELGSVLGVRAAPPSHGGVGLCWWPCRGGIRSPPLQSYH